MQDPDHDVEREHLHLAVAVKSADVVGGRNTLERADRAGLQLLVDRLGRLVLGFPTVVAVLKDQPTVGSKQIYDARRPYVEICEQPVEKA